MSGNSTFEFLIVKEVNEYGDVSFEEGTVIHSTWFKNQVPKPGDGYYIETNITPNGRYINRVERFTKDE